jgi:hypothetical protein
MLAVRQFDSGHTSFDPKCACGGDPDNCTTRKFNPAEDRLQVGGVRK